MFHTRNERAIQFTNEVSDALLIPPACMHVCTYSNATGRRSIVVRRAEFAKSIVIPWPIISRGARRRE